MAIQIGQFTKLFFFFFLMNEYYQFSKTKKREGFF